MGCNGLKGELKKKFQPKKQFKKINLCSQPKTKKYFNSKLFQIIKFFNIIFKSIILSKNKVMILLNLFF